MLTHCAPFRLCIAEENDTSFIDLKEVDRSEAARLFSVYLFLFIAVKFAFYFSIK